MANRHAARGTAGIWTVALVLSLLYAGVVVDQWRSVASLPALMATLLVAGMAIHAIRDAGRDL